MDLFLYTSTRREELVRSSAYSATNKFVPYELVAPVRIREFLRETKGEIATEVIKEKKKKRRKKRFKEDNAPRHGTTHEDFKAGEPGLIDSPTNSRPNSRS